MYYVREHTVLSLEAVKATGPTRCVQDWHAALSRHAPEQANLTNAKLLEQAFKREFGPSAAPPSTAPFSAAADPIRALRIPFVGTSRSLSGTARTIIANKADRLRQRRLHWSWDPNGNQKLAAGLPKPLGSLRVVKKGCEGWTEVGRETIEQIREEFISLPVEQLSIIKAQFPQLQTLQGEDWSVAEAQLHDWLHASMKTRWESKQAQRFKVEDELSVEVLHKKLGVSCAKQAAEGGGKGKEGERTPKKETPKKDNGDSHRQTVRGGEAAPWLQVGLRRHKATVHACAHVQCQVLA